MTQEIDAKRLAPRIFHLVVDYALSVETMVASGEYNWMDQDVSSDNFHFDRRDKIEVLAELVHFNRIMYADEAYCELDKLGYRPANLVELLVFGAAYPEEQLKYQIVALGSVWQDLCGGHDAASLDGDQGRRELGLSTLEHGWRKDWRFLAVRK